MKEVCELCNRPVHATKVLGSCPQCAPDVVDEDWLTGVSCNSDSPEECESCQ